MKASKNPDALMDSDPDIEIESQQDADSQPIQTRHPGGRPPGIETRGTITEGRLKVIVTALEDGCSVTEACRLANVDPDSLRKRMQRDPAVGATVKRARAACEHYHMRRIKAGGQGWQSSAWWLERAQGYVQDRKPETSQKESQPVQVQLVVVFGQGEAKERRKVRSHLKAAEQSAKVIDV